jgi:Ca-activated chloride channel family protein
LIIISDGEDHSDNAKDAAEEAKELGIKIITIGVGSENGGRIPLKINGIVEGFQLDKNGEIVVTKRNPEVLTEIAKVTNGNYIDGNNTKAVVDFITERLKNIEKNEFEGMEMANFQSQFQWFLGIGFFLLLLDLGMTERKTKWVKKLNLFNEKEDE